MLAAPQGLASYNDSLQDRDHTSITMAIKRSDLKRAKELIRFFEDRFSEELAVKEEQTSGDEVYRLSVSFFPLTKIKEQL